MEKFIIINETNIRKRIQDLENIIEEKKIDVETERLLRHELKQILSESKPLISELKSAYDAGRNDEKNSYLSVGRDLENEYFSNLKFDM